MYVILVYDVGVERCAKLLKLCRKYLNWIQNSVFEGEISSLKLNELLLEAKKIMDMQTDSLLYFSSRNSQWLDKGVLGVEKNTVDNFL